MTITKDIKYIGVNDKKIDLFEGQYKVPAGMSYNSYAIIDEKIAIMDTVDVAFTHEWLDNIQNALGGEIIKNKKMRAQALIFLRMPRIYLSRRDVLRHTAI